LICVERPVTFLSSDYELMGVVHIPSTGFNSSIIMLHGFTGNRVEAGRLFVDLARALCSIGVSVLRFDFRGHGDSPLSFEDFRLDYALEDAENAVEYVEATLKPRRIGLLGLSMGGHIAVKTAYRLGDRVSSLVLLAPAIDFGKIMEEVVKGIPVVGDTYILGPHRLRREGVESIIRSNAMSLAEGIKSPTLIIHAKNDEAVPYTQSVEFYNKLRVEKKLTLLDEGGHVFTTYASRSRVIEEVSEWARHTL